MCKKRIILLIFVIFLIAGLYTPDCRGQFFWLGFQAGEGVSWFSHQGSGNTVLSEGSGTSFSFFVRYGYRPYYQIAFEWLFSYNQMKFEVSPGTTRHDNIPFHNFKVPFTAGYEIIHTPRFKWRMGGGAFIGRTVILESNAFNLQGKDIRNPQFGIIGETGIQFLNLIVLVDYNYSLTKFFSKDFGQPGIDSSTHLEIFSLKVGLQF